MVATIDLIWSLLIGLGMLAVAVVPALLWKKRHGVGGRWFLWGALLISVALGVKAVLGFTITSRVNLFLTTHLSPAPASILYFLFIGAQTVLTEVGLTYVLIKKKLRSASASEAVAFGIGYGGMEASLFGALAVVSVALVAIAPQILPPQLLQNTAVDPLMVLAPILERGAAISIHILSALWLWETAASGRWGSFWKAALIKGALDSYVPAFQPLKDAGVAGLYLLELPIYLLGLGALVGLKNYLRNESRRIGKAALVILVLGFLSISLVALMAPRFSAGSSPEGSSSLASGGSLLEVNPACNFPVVIRGDRLAPEIPDGERVMLNKCLTDKENLPEGTLVAFQEEGQAALRLGIIAGKKVLAEGTFYQVTMEVRTGAQVTIPPSAIMAVR